MFNFNIKYFGPKESLRRRAWASQINPFPLCDIFRSIKSSLHHKARKIKRLVYIPLWNFFLDKSRASFKLINQQDLINMGQALGYTLYEKSKYEAPQIYSIDENGNQKVLSLAEMVFVQPIKCIEIRNVKAVASSNLLYKDEYAVCGDYFDPLTDYTSEELHCNISIKNNYVNCHLLNEEWQFEEAALFLDALSSNYAHWVTEILTRLVVFCNLEMYKNIPVIIDESWHPNMLEIVSYFIPGRDVYVLKPRTQISVSRAIIISPCGYVPFECRPGYDGALSSGTFSIDALKLIRGRLLKIAAPTNMSRVYIKRKSWGRNALNESDVEEALNKTGFVTQDPSALTVIDQISIFSSADIIYSNSGAALVNLIFCKPGCKVYISIPDLDGTSYHYWNKIAQVSGAVVTYLLERPVRPDIHSDFFVNINRLTKVLS